MKNITLIKEFAQVMTPSRVVKDMLNLLDKECFEDVNTVFLEPSCGTGNFVIEVLKRKIRANKYIVKSADDAYSVVLKALESIKAIDLDPRMVEYTQYRIAKFVQRYITLYKPTLINGQFNHFRVLDVLLAHIIRKNIIQGDFLEMAKLDE